MRDWRMKKPVDCDMTGDIICYILLCLFKKKTI